MSATSLKPITKSQVQVPIWVHLILNDKVNERFVVTGGVGSGKTSGAGIVFFVNALRNHKEKEWWIIAPTHSRVDDSVLPAVVWAFSALGFREGRDYRVFHSKPKYIFFFRTRQFFRFHSGDRPETMVSATIGGYWITEPGIMKRQVYEEAEKRTRSKRVDRTIGIIEGTPEGDNWYKEEFDIDRVDPVRKLRRVILETYDNEHNLDANYITRLLRLFAHEPAKIKAYIHGLFSSFRSGDVYSQFIETRNVIDRIEPDPNRPIVLCYDFNYLPLTWTAWQLHPVAIGGRYKLRDVCIAESGLSTSGLFESAVEVGRTFPEHIYKNTKFELWGDRSGYSKSHKVRGNDFTNLQKHLSEIYNNVVIKAKEQVTPIRASADVVNRMFLYEMMVVCEHCINTRRSLTQTKWDKDKSDIEKTSGETHTHHGDGLRYHKYWLYKDVDMEILTEKNTIGFNPV